MKCNSDVYRRKTYTNCCFLHPRHFNLRGSLATPHCDTLERIKKKTSLTWADGERCRDECRASFFREDRQMNPRDFQSPVSFSFRGYFEEADFPFPRFVCVKMIWSKQQETLDLYCEINFKFFKSFSIIPLQRLSKNEFSITKIHFSILILLTDISSTHKKLAVERSFLNFRKHEVLFFLLNQTIRPFDSLFCAFLKYSEVANNCTNISPRNQSFFSETIFLTMKLAEWKKFASAT